MLLVVTYPHAWHSQRVLECSAKQLRGVDLLVNANGVVEIEVEMSVDNSSAAFPSPVQMLHTVAMSFSMSVFFFVENL